MASFTSMRRAVLGTAFLLLLPSCAAPPASPPNVLLVVIDTLRADGLGSYGAERDTSPALDALAAGAVRFDRAYATAPWTQPSVASMFTGLPPHAHGLERPGRLPEAARTLAERLRGAGYATAAVVSHGLLGRRTGFDQGFDDFDDSDARRSTPGETTRAVTFSATARLDALAAKDAPFFLLVHYFDPHYEYLRHDDVAFAGARAGRLDGTQTIRELRELRHDLDDEERAFLRAVYDEEIRHTDAGVGRLLAHLQRLGRFDDTLILVTADHGEEFLERGWIGHTRTLYDELLRVPLIIRPPGGEGGGHVVDEPVSLASVTATVTDYAGLPPADDARTRPSLRDAIEGGRAPEAPVLFEVDFVPLRGGLDERVAHKRGALFGTTKVIRDEASGRIEIYDLAKDPDEAHDLAAADAARAQEATARLDALYAEARDVPPREGVAWDQEELDRLAELGYALPAEDEGSAPDAAD